MGVVDSSAQFTTESVTERELYLEKRLARSEEKASQLGDWALRAADYIEEAAGSAYRADQRARYLQLAGLLRGEVLKITDC